MYPVAERVGDSIVETRFCLCPRKDVTVVQHEYRYTSNSSAHCIVHFLTRQCRLVRIVHETGGFFGAEAMPRGDCGSTSGAPIFCARRKYAAKSESVRAC